MGCRVSKATPTDSEIYIRKIQGYYYICMDNKYCVRYKHADDALYMLKYVRRNASSIEWENNPATASGSVHTCT